MDTIEDSDEITSSLKKHNVGTVILRMNLDPKDYWEKRKEYETKLTGSKKIHLFSINKKNVICKKLD